MAKCPAHADARSSLSIREGRDGAALVHCFAGCQTEDVLAAIGLQMGDLFPRQMPVAPAARSLREDPSQAYRHEIRRARKERLEERPWSNPRVLIADVNLARDRLSRAGATMAPLPIPDVETDFPGADDGLWQLCVDRAIIEKFAGLAPIDWARQHWRSLPRTHNRILDRASQLLHEIGRASL